MNKKKKEGNSEREERHEGQKEWGRTEEHQEQ